MRWEDNNTSRDTVSRGVLRVMEANNGINGSRNEQRLFLSSGTRSGEGGVSPPGAVLHHLNHHQMHALLQAVKNKSHTSAVTPSA